MNEKLVFEVTVWIRYFSKIRNVTDACYIYNLIAEDDYEARAMAISKVKAKYLAEDFIKVIYCETRMLAQLDN
jgi:hypothetical protein